MMALEESDATKYFNDDTVFNAINKEFVSLQDADIKRNNVHLKRVVCTLIQKMQYEDSFFKKVYQRLVHGGSYYKETKVGHPDEYDLNIVIKLPINYNFIRVESCNHPGFVVIHSGLSADSLNNNTNIDNKTFRNLLDSNMYLNQEKFRCWIESTLSKTLNKLPQENYRHILLTDNGPYRVKLRKSGPAFTLHIYVYDSIYTEEICVDLVPVLELSHELPYATCDLSGFQKKTWYAVPKPLENYGIIGNIQLYWRTCFYEQEKEILRKNGKIKPVLRQMKKLRNTQNWKHMSSYYIETLFLHALEESLHLQRKSSTFLFMMMLQKFHDALADERIPYYWNTQYNLLDRFSFGEIYNLQRRLRNIINFIHKNIKKDSYIIASYILEEDEFIALQNKLDARTSSDEEFSDDEEPEENNNGRCVIL